MNRCSLSCRQAVGAYRIRPEARRMIVTGIRVRAFVSSMGRVGAYAIRPYNLPAGNKMTLISGLAPRASFKMNRRMGDAHPLIVGAKDFSPLRVPTDREPHCISGLARRAKGKMHCIS